MKKMTKLTAVVCAAVMTAALGFTSLAEGNPLGPVMMEGTVVSVENGCLTMNRVLGNGTEEILINISDDTKILESVDGYPIPGESGKRRDNPGVCGSGHDHESSAHDQRSGNFG